MRLTKLGRNVPLALFGLLILSACDQQAANSPDSSQPLIISAIPDQDPEKLQRLYGIVATYLSTELAVLVEYKPVTDYTASVTAFKVGDLHLVWYGGLTGVQSRLQVPNARAIVQRDIDEKFHSVLIANTASGINTLQDIKGKTFTFGSESSTSGRLMPQHFLRQEGIQPADFRGEPGFSGSHDKTLSLVAAGTFDAGVLNEQVWKSRQADGSIDLSNVKEIYRTPAYHDYHWVLHPEATTRYGADFPDKVKAAFLKLDPAVAEHKEILDLFGAGSFIETEDSNYAEIEQVGREIGLVTTP